MRDKYFDEFDAHDMPHPECPHPEPAPDFPPFCPDDRPEFRKKHPHVPPMPPVPSVVSGMDLYEAMNHLSDRVNVCIHNYNAVMAENYKTLHNLQRAAEENGAYYDPHSVWVEEGYYADESSTYHLIHKSCVDRRGEPIRMQLHLAYGNTTNSQIEQSMFNASKVEYADKMVVAIPKSDKGWYGKAIYHGCPIASADEPELFTVGFTKSGAMRVYSNGANVDQMLRDTIVDAMGCSGVLIQNGQITDEAYRKNIPYATEQVSRVVMGQVGATREVVILTVGNEDDVTRKGLTSMACAQILKQYGCDIAVELCEGKGSGALDKGSLMYVPDGNEEPSAYAYWFISRKCFYRNDYERELAELVQNYGACIWQGFLNKKAIAKVKAELDAEIERAKGEEDRLDKKIDAETERAEAEEARLDEKIDTETARAEEAERVLQENIDKETERAKAEEQRLDEKIDAETARAEEAERVLQENIDKETERAKAEEARLDEKIDAETARATSEEQRIEGRLNEEIDRATTEEKRLDEKIDVETERAEKAEQKLTEDLDAEVHRATNAEAILHQEILTEQGERIAADTVLQTNINTEASTRASEDAKLQQNIDAEVTRATTAETTLQTNIDNEVSRAKSEEKRIEDKVDAETLRATQAETKLQEGIDAEAERAKSAESDLQKAIDAETKRATGAETKLASDLDAEVHAREDADVVLHDEVNAVDGKVDALTLRVSECESDIANLQTLTTSLQQQMSALDATVAGMLSTVSDLEKAMNEVKLLVHNMESTVNQITGEFTSIKERLDTIESDIAGIELEIEHIIDGTTELPYVKKSGDTMTGSLAMSSNKITGVADGADDADAVNVGQLNSAKSELDGKISNITDGTTELPYVKKTGDTMTGSLTLDYGSNLTMNGGALKVNEYSDPMTRYVSVKADSSATMIKCSQGDGSAELNTTNNRVFLRCKSSSKQTADEVNFITYGAAGKPIYITSYDSNSKRDYRTIKGIGEGVDDHDVVAVSQLNSAKSELDGKITNITDGTTELPYVKKSGDTMTGSLAMSGNKITGVADGADDADAVTVSQLNTEVTRAKAAESEISTTVSTILSNYFNKNNVTQYYFLTPVYMGSYTSPIEKFTVSKGQICVVDVCLKDTDYSSGGSSLHLALTSSSNVLAKSFRLDNMIHLTAMAGVTAASSSDTCEYGIYIDQSASDSASGYLSLLTINTN